MNRKSFDLVTFDSCIDIVGQISIFEFIFIKVNNLNLNLVDCHTESNLMMFLIKILKARDTRLKNTSIYSMM